MLVMEYLLHNLVGDLDLTGHFTGDNPLHRIRPLDMHNAFHWHRHLLHLPDRHLSRDRVLHDTLHDALHRHWHVTVTYCLHRNRDFIGLRHTHLVRLGYWPVDILHHLLYNWDWNRSVDKPLDRIRDLNALWNLNGNKEK